jgi:hypothetical protein
MGSLRPSEILSHSIKEFDPTKCLLAQDLKRLVVRIDGQETAIVQLTLKNPKTSRTMPNQIVQRPETHNQSHEGPNQWEPNLCFHIRETRDW